MNEEIKFFIMLLLTFHISSNLNSTCNCKTLKSDSFINNNNTKTIQANKTQNNYIEVNFTNKNILLTEFNNNKINYYKEFKYINDLNKIHNAKNSQSSKKSDLKQKYLKKIKDELENQEEKSDLDVDVILYEISKIANNKQKIDKKEYSIKILVNSELVKEPTLNNSVYNASNKNFKAFRFDSNTQIEKNNQSAKINTDRNMTTNEYASNSLNNQVQDNVEIINKSILNTAFPPSISHLPINYTILILCIIALLSFTLLIFFKSEISNILFDIMYDYDVVNSKYGYEVIFTTYFRNKVVEEDKLKEMLINSKFEISKKDQYNNFLINPHFRSFLKKTIKLKRVTVINLVYMLILATMLTVFIYVYSIYLENSIQQVIERINFFDKFIIFSSVLKLSLLFKYLVVLLLVVVIIEIFEIYQRFTLFFVKSSNNIDR